MTDHRPSNDDLLSAYFDGETTPDERAEAERRLHASTDARRELNEIGEVSQLLRSLPHEGLPRDFAAQVLARAEREMLLAAPAPPEAIVRTGLKRRRARWFALGSLVATAALVLAV
ncbi:MAG: anti-sigma factor family protein, partial [Haloechinothrix sp.]